MAIQGLKIWVDSSKFRLSMAENKGIDKITANIDNEVWIQKTR